MKNMIKKNIKKNIKENIVIFFLLFSLKNNEENKRKKEKGKGGENFIRLLSSSPEPAQHTRVGLAMQKAIDDSVRGGVAEDEGPLPGEKTMTATSTLHKKQSSPAFLKSPVRRLEKVTSKDLFFSIFFISIFCLPMLCFFTIFVFAEDMLCFFTLCLP